MTVASVTEKRKGKKKNWVCERDGVGGWWWGCRWRRWEMKEEEGVGYMASSPTSCWLIRSCWAGSPESCIHAGLTHPQTHTCDSSESRTRSVAAIVARCNKRNSICHLCYCISDDPWRGAERMTLWPQHCWLPTRLEMSYSQHLEVTNISQI